MILGNKIKPERREPMMINSALSDNFNHRFAVVTADTLALQKQAYRLRYQVYCIENRFENTLDHPLEQEIDEFDARSVHSVVIDRPSQTVTGTVRLILPNPTAIEKSFPIQKVCSHPLLQSRKLLYTARSAEISRFAVSKEFSRMAAGPPTSRRHTDFSDEKQASVSNITLGLLNGVVRMSLEHGITEWFAVMEPTLLRLLARFGIYFSPIGPMVDYHGMRQPCHAIIENLLDRARKERIDVWKIVTDNGRLLDREDQQFAPFRLSN